mgnify:CR=1 FL=1
MAQVERLVQLIREFGAEEGLSQDKIEKIVALVERSLKMGVPEVDDLMRTLEQIGGSS